MNWRRLAARAAYGARTLLLRQQAPYLLGLVLTDRCNLSCAYCESRNRGDGGFTWEQARAALVAGHARGHRSLYFTGGEPTIWRDGQRGLGDLVGLARAVGFFDLFIATNGTQPLDAPGCSYLVTVDGPRRIHDRLRSGTWDQVMSNVRAASSAAVFASITLTRANRPYLREFVEEVTDLGIFRGISFNLLTARPEVLAKQGLLGAERLEALDELRRLKREGFPIVTSGAALRALRANDWKRPIVQIELATRERVFTCCRDVEDPSICRNCGYSTCVEVSQILALEPSALMQVLKMVD